jgi:hypothetical protein
VHSLDSTVQYIANLHNNFHLSLSQAYARGVEQFVQLRALHEIATFAAETEAVYHGATYKKNVFVGIVPVTVVVALRAS